jgi:hypothetical protein
LRTSLTRRIFPAVDTPSKRPETPVFSEIARRLADRVADLAKRPTRALVAGHAVPILDILNKQFQNIEQISLSDQPPQKPCDLLIGHLELGQDPAQILAAATPHLAPDSPILLSLLGHGSFAEIPQPPRLPDVRDLGDSAQVRALALPVIDRDRLTLTFASPDAARRTLEAHNWPAANFNINKLTIEIIYIHGHTKGPHQPQALKPGSGKVSLVKILHNNSDS